MNPMEPGRGDWAGAVGAALGAFISGNFVLDLWGAEFSGGQTTGVLLNLDEAGCCAFVIGAISHAVRLGPSAFVSMLAAILCLPLYLYLTCPGISRLVLSGSYSVQVAANFVFDPWAVAGLLVFTLSMGLGIFAQSPRQMCR